MRGAESGALVLKMEATKAQLRCEEEVQRLALAVHEAVDAGHFRSAAERSRNSPPGASRIPQVLGTASAESSSAKGMAKRLWVLSCCGVDFHHQATFWVHLYRAFPGACYCPCDSVKAMSTQRRFSKSEAKWLTRTRRPPM